MSAQRQMEASGCSRRWQISVLGTQTAVQVTQVDELEQRRPTQYLTRVLVVQERPSMLGTVASWNNTE